MKKRKKLTALLLCITMLLTTMFVGCSGVDAGTADVSNDTNSGNDIVENNNDSATDDTKQADAAASDNRWVAEEKVNIRFGTHLLSKDSEKEGWQKIVEEYNKIQPNVEIELVPMDGSNTRTWLTMQLTGGTAPEVFHSRLFWATEDFNKGLIMDLTNLMHSKNPYTDTETWEEFYAPAVIEQLNAQSPSYYSVCNFMSIVKLFYNKEMFEDAGIGELPKTWTEFIEVQKELKEAGYTPFSFPMAKPSDALYKWSERLLTSQLIEHLLPELDVNKSNVIEINEFVRGVDQDIINITKRPFSDVFVILKDWNQYWAEGYNAIDSAMAEEMFIREETAMMMGFPTTVENMKEMGATFEYGVFTFPYLTKEDSEFACEASYEMGANVTEVFCIPSNLEGEKLKAAQDFLMYLGSPAGMALVAESFFLMPTAAEAVTDSLDGWAPEGKIEKLNLYGAAVDQTFSDDSVMFGQLYLEGSISLEEYVNELQNSLKNMVERAKDTNGWNEENNYMITQ